MEALHLPQPVDEFLPDSSSPSTSSSISAYSQSSCDDPSTLSLSFPSPLWLKFIARGMGYNEIRTSLSSHFVSLAEKLKQAASTQPQSFASSDNGGSVPLSSTSFEAKGPVEMFSTTSQKENGSRAQRTTGVHHAESITGLEELVSEYGKYMCTSLPSSFSSSFLTGNAALFTRMMRPAPSSNEARSTLSIFHPWERPLGAERFAPARAAVRLVVYACVNMEKPSGQSSEECAGGFPVSPLALENASSDAAGNKVERRNSTLCSSTYQRPDEEGPASSSSFCSPACTLTRFCQEFPQFSEEANKIFCTSVSNDVTAKRFAVFCLALLNGAPYYCSRPTSTPMKVLSDDLLTVSHSLKDNPGAEEWRERGRGNPSRSPHPPKTVSEEMYRVEAFTYAMRVIKPEAIAYGGAGWVYALGRFWASTPSFNSAAQRISHPSGGGKRWSIPGWGGVHDVSAFFSPAQQRRHRCITLLCRASLSGVVCAMCGVYSHSLLDWRRRQLLLSHLSPPTHSDINGIDRKAKLAFTSTTSWSASSGGSASQPLEDILLSQRVVRLQAITYASTAVALATSCWRLQSIAFPRWMGDVCFRFPWMVRLFPSVVGLTPSSTSSFSVSTTKSLVPYVVTPFLLVSWWRSNIYMQT